jgi:hypothetical protein
MPRAGQNVRVMALEHRIKALSLFGMAGLMVGFPFLLSVFLRRIFPKVSPVTLPNFTYLIFFLLAGLIAMQACYFWIRANNATQGALGEEKIATTLKPLQSQDWQVEYNVPIRGLGDVDVFLLSPQGNAYTIDVKSHKGEVNKDGKQLYRQYGRSRYSFEKDFLREAKRQAVSMKELKKLKFVTPIVAFSSANVLVGRDPVAGVYVLGVSELVPCLRSLE